VKSAVKYVTNIYTTA